MNGGERKATRRKGCAGGRAGQTPGDTLGNGRAIALLFAREGARVMAVARHLERATETKRMIAEEKGEAYALEADITRAADCKKMADLCVEVYGAIDVLVNNVGIGEIDGGPVTLAEETWDRTLDTNLKGMFLTCKYVLPYMEQQPRGGSIVNVSSTAAVRSSGQMLAYKVSKAGVNALTHCIAMRYAAAGIRVNAIMLGHMNTPIAMENLSKARGISKKDLAEMRNQAVPLRGGMGDAWDSAYAALFLASDEAKFIPSVVLPVDGGYSSRIGSA